MNDEMVYTCRNYRPNNPPRQLPGACFPHVGQIIADLYTPEGVFHRCAVVADVGARGLRYAQSYCDKQNQMNKEKRVEARQPGVNW